jgi:hypothetical protein
MTTQQNNNIPFIDHPNKNLPNFIIALTGQSNAEGFRSSYDPTNPYDQPNERIFGWNPVLKKWQIADLRTESLGWSYATFKQKGTQCSSFHFAKRLIETYPTIRPGIINVGVSGATIAFWTNWKETYQYYALSQTKLLWYNGRNTFPDYKTRSQGYIFDVHIEEIKFALNYLPNTNKIVNVICWDQGESDPQLDYYKASLYQVYNRYKNTLQNLGFYNPIMFGFIGISTTGMLYNNGIKVNDVLKQLNTDDDPLTRYVDASDLSVATVANQPDMYHFSTISQRTIGTRCFEQYTQIFN